MPLCYLTSKAPKTGITSEDFTYEITVNSPTVDSAKFILTITGFILAQNGIRKPFKMEKKDLTTPYKLTLNNGKYRAIIESKAATGVVISKIQGMQDGKKVGYASGSSRKTILDFGFGGNYLIKEE